MDNAVKYTPEGGSVEVRLDASGSFAVVEVRDTGIGISDEDKRKIFDEFYRVKCGYTSKVAGTGLGLSLVKNLVELHKGRISVESAPGKGSTFIVKLPRFRGKNNPE